VNAKRSARRLAEARDQLARVVEGEWRIGHRIPEMLAECLGAERTLFYQLEAISQGVRLAAVHCDTQRMTQDARTIFGGWLEQGRPFAHFDATCPDPKQRNSVLTLGSLRKLVPRRPEDEAIYGELWPRMGLANCEQLRVLVCEGDSLLAWIGGFQGGRFRPSQKRVLRALAPAMRQRLSWERRIEETAIRAAGFEELIEGTTRPAFLVSGTGKIVAENEAARRWLNEDLAGVRECLAQARREPHRYAAEAISINVRSIGQTLTLLMLARQYVIGGAQPLPGGTAGSQTRQRLPPSLLRVAQSIAAGLSDKEIAAAHHLSVSTVRTYVRQVYSLMGVHNRVQLADALRD
jgi:hypothetical protein